MVRQTDIRRDTNPAKDEIFSSEGEREFLEAQNGALQLNEVLRLIDVASSEFRLTSEVVKDLNRIAIQNIFRSAGQYRQIEISIAGTDHQPPTFTEVPQFVKEMCDYVAQNWSKSPIHLAAYIMWRLNWIHPFRDGNGRTSRAVSYLVLCIKLGFRLPGTLTIPEQIVANRQPYYEALDSADAAWQQGRVDVSQMEELLSRMLALQLAQVLHRAKSSDV